MDNVKNNLRGVPLHWYQWCNIQGRTDKKLTTALVIRIFLSFELADIFLKYGSLFFQKSFKKFDFHPHRQQQRRHNPLDPAWHHYAVSPPERLHFIGLSLHAGNFCACSDSGEFLLRSVRRLREHCMSFVPLWVLTRHLGCYQVTVESSPHSLQTHLCRTCSKHPRPVAPHFPHPPFSSFDRIILLPPPWVLRRFASSSSSFLF